jgi:hypothetical protein
MFVPKTTLLALLVHGTSAEVLGHHPSDEKTMEHNPALSGGDAVNNRSPGLLRGSAEESGGDESGRLLQGCWGDGTFCDSIEEFPGPGSCENCCNAGSFWPDRMYFACGQMPCWGTNTRCMGGTTCNSCCNGYRWVWEWFGDHCNWASIDHWHLATTLQFSVWIKGEKALLVRCMRFRLFGLVLRGEGSEVTDLAPLLKIGRGQHLAY